MSTNARRSGRARALGLWDLHHDPILWPNRNPVIGLRSVKRWKQTEAILIASLKSLWEGLSFLVAQDDRDSITTPGTESVWLDAVLETLGEAKISDNTFDVADLMCVLELAARVFHPNRKMKLSRVSLWRGVLVREARNLFRGRTVPARHPPDPP